jgi:hypothetical protein
MVPVMFAATATLGQPNTANSPAASHNLFRVSRMIRSLVIGPPYLFREFYTGPPARQQLI